MEKQTHSHLDAGEQFFFNRQLEYIKARSYDILFPELKARTLIPVSYEAGPGAESITYDQYDQVGMAKIVANYTTDFPRADVKGKQHTARVKSLGASYGYNVQEIRAAKMAGKPLQQRRANAAKRAILQKENQVAFFGDDEFELQGFLNNPNITNVILQADGEGDSTKFADKTSDQILRDLNSIVSTIHETTKGVESPDTLLLPLAQYNLLWTTRMNTYSNISVLKYFLDNNLHIKQVEWLNELKEASSGQDVMIAYTRSPEKVTLEIPQDFEQFPAQEQGLDFVVPCHERIGGVIIYYPLSVAKAEGI